MKYKCLDLFRQKQFFAEWYKMKVDRSKINKYTAWEMSYT